MSIAVQVALVMVVLLVLLLAAGVPMGGNRTSSAVSMICMLPSNVAFATSAQSDFWWLKLIFTDRHPVLYSCRKHYE